MKQFGNMRFNAARPIGQVGYAPDGSLVALTIAGSQSELVHFDPETGAQRRRIPLAEGWRGFRYTPRGAAVWGGSGHWILADPETGAERARFDQGERIEGLALSPDCRLAASTGAERFEVWIWELATGQPLHALTGHTKDVWCAAFSPDGRLLATGGWDGRILLWDAATGAQVAARKCNNVRDLRFSSDGALLLTGSGNGQVRLWSVPALKSAPGFSVRHTFARGGNAGVQCVRFAPDDQVIYASSNDGTLRAWSRGGRALWAAACERGATFALSPDGSSIAVGGHGCQAGVLDASTGAPVFPEPPQAACKWLGFAADGRIGVYRGGGGFSILDSERGRILHAEDTTPWQSMRFSPAGGLLAVRGGGVQLRDDRSMEERGRIQTSAGALHGFSPDGRLLAVSGEAEIALWDTASLTRVSVLAHSEAIKRCVFGPTGDWLVSAGTARVTLWSLDPVRQLAEITLPENTFGAAGLALSPSGRRIAVATRRFVTVWDTVSRAQVMQLAAPPRRELHELGFTGEDRLAAVDDSGAMNLADADAGAWLERRIAHSERSHWMYHEGRPLAVSPDLTRVAVSGMDHLVTLWPTGPGRREAPLGLDELRGAGAATHPLDTGRILGERFAGLSFLLVGRFDSISRAAAERRIKALGGRVVKKASASLTALVVGAARGAHKPPAAQRAAEALIAGGAPILVIAEGELVRRLTPTVEEAVLLLTGGPEGTAAWNGWRGAYGPKPAQLPGVLDGAKLDGADLRQADLAGVSMIGISLVGADLRGARLSECALRGADLRDARLDGLDAWRADLTGADLRGASLTGGKLWHCSFHGADLRGADLSQADTRWSKHDPTTRWPEGFAPA